MPISLLSSKGLQFLSDDVEAQLRISRRIAGCVEQLSDLKQELAELEVPDEKVREIRAIRNELIILGRELAPNAHHTSTTISPAVIRAHSEISRENVRWKVTSVVIWVYAVVILSTIFYLIISSFVYSEDMFGNIIEVIKIALIPVVTFIVGYYYGTSSKS
jgi:hypothetical protein